ncbi:BT_3928 family protein [Urechidicola vernalis]|uniref:DoxX family protein n=1 Tax=Urechidicola vernalis TaxID=3075600 RepID=A0ABU2Y3Q0_9FLAO|nr:BT_3928 family protein [Urechidicola sp. P050]MDT0552831.1 DoxX family protein [Urechidicola sp. P050]
MKLLVLIARLFVAATFLFSGFVKLVDPLGSAYKFQEYFSADVLNLESFIPYALPFSIVLILIEIMLGVMLLIGFKPKLTTWSLFLITLVFLFLTWYSAYYDKVTDCGCFGDAIKLTPWETFNKNVVLIIVIAFLILARKYITPIMNNKALNWISLGSLMVFMYISYHVLVHLPLIDFRPYAVGKNIQQGMTEIAVDGLPKVHDFYLETNDGDDLTDELLNKDKVMFVVMYDLDVADSNGFSQVKTTTDLAMANGYTVYGLSASYIDDLLELNANAGLNMEWLFVDATVLKTIIRANPGIITMDKGTVTGKWNWIDADDFKP